MEPTVTRPVQDPLAVLNLNNQRYMQLFRTSLVMYKKCFIDPQKQKVLLVKTVGLLVERRYWTVIEQIYRQRSVKKHLLKTSSKITLGFYISSPQQFEWLV